MIYGHVPKVRKIVEPKVFPYLTNVDILVDIRNTHSWALGGDLSGYRMPLILHYRAHVGNGDWYKVSPRLRVPFYVPMGG